MSEPIYIRKFSQLFTLYIFVSLIIHFATGFTIAASLIYLITLLPFSLLCVAHVASLAQKHPHSLIRYRKFLVYPIAITQTLVIFSSPSNCYGMKQGNTCHSVIQSLFSDFDSNSLSNLSTDWSRLELIFPIALTLYGISMLVFLGTLRNENKLR